MLISSILTDWYLEKKRDLPWRNTANPYYIWVSEIILQQTRVAQGIGYYERFISAFPDIQALANAEINDVLKVWQGLGYYSRARNLHAGAKYVVQQFKGVLPASYEKLMQIKGVGEYTAAAIGSIAYNLPLPVVDGNVNRVISRVFGIHDPINSLSGSKQIKEIALKIINKESPALHNQAIMEFGALQCAPHNPDCEACPLKEGCYALSHNEVAQLPQKINKTKIRERYFNYLVVLYKDYIAISKRSENDIWHGLYEFPLIETHEPTTENQLMVSPDWEKFFKDMDYKIIKISKIYPHKLTHQKINTRFFVITVDDKPKLLIDRHTLFVEKGAIQQYPVSKLVGGFLSVLGL
jgi:A/G-specific adenine glycosylase